MIISLVAAQPQKILNPGVDFPVRHVVVFRDQVIERPGAGEDCGRFGGSHELAVRNFNCHFTVYGGSCVQMTKRKHTKNREDAPIGEIKLKLP